MNLPPADNLRRRSGQVPDSDSVVLGEAFLVSSKVRRVDSSGAVPNVQDQRRRKDDRIADLNVGVPVASSGRRAVEWNFAEWTRCLYFAVAKSAAAINRVVLPLEINKVIQTVTPNCLDLRDGEVVRIEHIVRSAIRLRIKTVYVERGRMRVGYYRVRIGRSPVKVGPDLRHLKRVEYLRRRRLSAFIADKGLTEVPDSLQHRRYGR